MNNNYHVRRSLWRIFLIVNAVLAMFFLVRQVGSAVNVSDTVSLTKQFVHLLREGNRSILITARRTVAVKNPHYGADWHDSWFHLTGRVVARTTPDGVVWVLVETTYPPKLDGARRPPDAWDRYDRDGTWVHVPDFEAQAYWRSYDGKYRKGDREWVSLDTLLSSAPSYRALFEALARQKARMLDDEGRHDLLKQFEALGLGSIDIGYTPLGPRSVADYVAMVEGHVPAGLNTSPPPGPVAGLIILGVAAVLIVIVVTRVMRVKESVR